jgi:predicted GH43/DUF377 family glycosyl hydrolase
MSLENFKGWKNWVDYKNNPLLTPKAPEWLVADPTFIPPGDSPDGKWHLFAHGILFGIKHFIASDGIKWIRTNSKNISSGMRPFLYKENNTYYLFYESISNPLKSTICYRQSSDLFNWSKPRIVLTPSLSWEGKISQNVSNPCFIKINGKYRLYYSGGSVFLRDCLFSEPKYIGFAESINIQGPYRKNPEPIIIPTKAHKFRNFGAGAMKVLKINDIWIGFNNGIYKDQYGRSRSSILLLYSHNGIEWLDLFRHPIIFPTEGWKNSFVYQLDVRKIGQNYWLYYNARHGWAVGWESIGLATLNIP